MDDTKNQIRRLMVYHAEDLAALRLNNTELRVFREIEKGNRIPMGIADALYLETANLTVVLHRLLKKGYIRRVKVPREGVGGVLYAYYCFTEGSDKEGAPG